MLRSIPLSVLLLLLVLTGCASDDGVETQKEDESWRTASQRVPDQSRRPSPREMAKQAKARDLLADEKESQAESETGTESETETESAEASAEIPDEPIRLDPDGPKDRDTYVRLQDGWSAPVKTHDPQPKYAAEARKARIQGAVILDALIDESGEVQGVDLVKGLPMGLNLEAYKAVKTWRFEPAVADGEPVRVIYRLTVNFRLQ